MLNDQKVGMNAVQQESCSNKKTAIKCEAVLCGVVVVVCSILYN